ncbi:MAG TPA: 3-phosphoshikimate 1-carboxyvinyltransferase [Actinomycetes bacterium]|nr:3-phosphoshikimate 1-carboxyvinyltransferase [Actinomycetes bacterium]
MSAGPGVGPPPGAGVPAGGRPRPVRAGPGVDDAVELLPAGPVRATLAAPASKSVTNRALVCAALADGESMLAGPLASDDSDAMREAVAALGARVADAGGAWRVRGTGGRPRSPDRPLDARLSGTTMRFLAAVATLTPAGATVTGRPGLLARPIGPLTAALRSLGAAVADAGGLPPVTAAGGGLAGGPVTVPTAWSSQFASAVLLVAPFARVPVRLAAEGLAAPGYVELTAEVMRWFGAVVERDGAASWRVEPGRYQARALEIEYDASAAGHLYALAAATGGEVTVANAVPGSRQPDAALPEVLARMGASVRRQGPSLTVAGPRVLAPVDVDLAAMPDQVTTVAVLAALAPGASRIRGVAVVRGHETDRLAALAAELAKLGVGVEERPDGLVVHGGRARLVPARIATHGDHRLAMAFAAVAARVPGVAIEDPGCVAKTYPGFWHDLAAAGVRWRWPGAGAGPGPGNASQGRATHRQRLT